RPEADTRCLLCITEWVTGQRIGWEHRGGVGISTRNGGHRETRNRGHIVRGVNANRRFASRAYAYSPPRNPGVRVFAAPHPGARTCSPAHPGVRTCGPSPALPWDPPLRGARFGGATRRPPLCGRPVGARIVW